MFIIATIVTLVEILLAGGPQGKPVEAVLTLYLPVWWLALIIYSIWGVAILTSFIAPANRFAVLEYMCRVGAHANMQVLDILLWGSSFLLASAGLILGNMNMLVAGSILALGLIGNAWEQRAII